MKSTLNQIENIKKHGYSLDFSTTFNHAFENYKKIAIYAGLILLVFSIIFGIAALGIIIAVYGIESISKDFIANLENLKLTYLQSIISAVGFSALGALASPFGAGFIKMADCADKDEEFNVSTIFTYYKAPYFAQIFAASFVIALAGSAINTSLENFGIPILGTVISLFISFFTCLTIPLLAFGNLKAIDAIKSSFTIISKQPFVILGLLITAGIFSALGLFACCIGVIFTIPFSYSMTYALYYAILGIDEKEDSINSIGKPDLE